MNGIALVLFFFAELVLIRFLAIRIVRGQRDIVILLGVIGFIVWTYVYNQGIKLTGIAFLMFMVLVATLMGGAIFAIFGVGHEAS